MDQGKRWVCVRDLGRDGVSEMGRTDAEACVWAGGEHAVW